MSKTYTIELDQYLDDQFNILYENFYNYCIERLYEYPTKEDFIISMIFESIYMSKSCVHFGNEVSITIYYKTWKDLVNYFQSHVNNRNKYTFYDFVNDVIDMGLKEL